MGLVGLVSVAIVDLQMIIGVEEVVIIPEWMQMQHLVVTIAEWDCLGTQVLSMDKGVAGEKMGAVGDHAGGVGEWEKAILSSIAGRFFDGVETTATSGKSKLISGG